MIRLFTNSELRYGSSNNHTEHDYQCRSFGAGLTATSRQWKQTGADNLC